jgi:hypothetical protein
MGEMFLSRPMFPGRSPLSFQSSYPLIACGPSHCVCSGKTDIAQMELIIRATGVPTEESWPGVTELPLYSSLISTTQSSLASLQSYSFISPTLRVPLSLTLVPHSLSLSLRLRMTKKSQIHLCLFWNAF